MNKVATLLLIAAGALFAAAPAFAAKPIPAAATIGISDPAPVWGELITLTASGDTVATDIEMVCTHAAGQSYSFSVINYNPGPYSDDVGLSAPNWPDSAATCVATVDLYTVRGHGFKKIVIGSLTFSVAP